MKNPFAPSSAAVRRSAPGAWLLLFTFLVLGILSASASDLAGKAVVRAAAFLDAANRGPFVVNYLHLGATYAGQKCLELAPVTDAKAQPLPGEFALVYRYYWNEKDNTDVAFFFDAKGNFESLRVLRTTAVAKQPFSIPAGVAQEMGNALITSFRREMSNTDQTQIRQLANQADTKALLELALRYQQALAS